MFFTKRLHREVLLDPMFQGAKMKAFVREKIFSELEGQCLGTYGYVISVVSVEDEDIQAGLIDIDTGAVNVSVFYTVILLRPFKNEVLDAVVTMASDESGFFARVGPLQIFVSRHCMPEDISFNVHAADCWVSQDEKVEIREGSIVRLRIIGLSIDAGNINAIGTINEAYLGQLEV